MVPSRKRKTEICSTWIWCAREGRSVSKISFRRKRSEAPHPETHMDLDILRQRCDGQPSRRALRLFLPHLVRSLAPYPPSSRQPRAIVRQLLVKTDNQIMTQRKTTESETAAEHSRGTRMRREGTNRPRSFLLWSSEPFERFLQVPSVLRVRLGMHRRDGSGVTAPVDRRDDGSRHARAVTAIRASAGEVGFRAVHRRRQVCGRVDDGLLVPLMVIKAESV